jgi:monothiol glutaredoxin
MGIQEVIKKQVGENRVVLYMKGTADFPQCGFSANAVGILRECGVNEIFTVNVLENPDLRQGIKDYANWPTVPQLYVNGEFVGGSDIMTEMYRSGELKKLLEKAPA